jgi:hypothetical protein
MEQKHLEIFERDITQFAKQMGVKISIDSIPQLDNEYVLVGLENHDRKVSYTGVYSTLRNTIMGAIYDMSPRDNVRPF